MSVEGADSWARPVGTVSSSLSGSAHDVIQARDVHGGVHFHAAPARVPIPHQLPADTRGFVGREGELARLVAAVDEGSKGVVVVVGTAGVGKTSLVVRAAHQLRGRFPDGQLFVNLRGYDVGPPLSAATALEWVLRALGIAPRAIPSHLDERTQLYRSLLSGRRMLVVLDNAATAGQVRPLLPGEAACLVLVTSRSRLSGLAAREGAYRLSLGLLDRVEATALVTAITTGYRQSDDPEQVAELARVCVYLPLALRIAAERAASNPWMLLRELIADLRDESALWDVLSTGDGEDADAVHAVFTWSYRALPLPAACAFRRLGLHPGPNFTVLAAAALIGESPQRTRGLLDLLVGAHLVEQNSTQRYQFHDLLRAYALSQVRVEESEQQQCAALARVADWYLYTADAAARTAQSFFPSVLAAQPNPALRILIFDDYASALRWHRAEQANLIALVRAAPTAGLDQIAWQLPATLHGLHVAHSPIDDWLEMGAVGLEAARRLGDQRAEALLHQSLGAANKAAGRLRQATVHHRAALRIRHDVGDGSGTSESAHSLGLVHLQQRELGQAQARFEQTLAFARQRGDQPWVAAALCCLAYTAAERGDLETAAHQASQALDLHREHATDLYLQIDPLLLLARAHREAGRVESASALVKQADSLASRLGYHALKHAVLLEYADLAHAEGLYEQALEHYWRYAALQSSTGDHLSQAIAFDGIGRTLRALGRLEEAIEFHQAAVRNSRKPPHPWLLATTLCHLAEAWQEAGRTDQTRVARAEAETMLADFTDMRAQALCKRLHALRDADEP